MTLGEVVLRLCLPNTADEGPAFSFMQSYSFNRHPRITAALVKGLARSSIDLIVALVTVKSHFMQIESHDRSRFFRWANLGVSDCSDCMNECTSL